MQPLGCRCHPTRSTSCSCSPAGSAASRASSTTPNQSNAPVENRGKPVAPSRRMATSTWQAATLVQCVSVEPWLLLPGEIEPGGCHDLTLGKIYECLGVEGRGAF